MYDIEFVNLTTPNVDYNKQVDNDIALGLYESSEVYTEQFERDYADLMRGCDADNIGGLIVYTRAGAVVAVYDYECFKGWFA